MKLALIGKGTWGNIIKKYIPENELKYFVGSKFDKNIIWNDPEIDGVIIATPIDTHFSIAEEAMENGKNVYIEKPITLNSEDAIDLKNIAMENNVKIGVDYTQTFSPSINKAQWAIKQIGKIEYIEMCSKQLGKFTEHNVYNVLGSHHLSVLNMFMNIDDLDFAFKDHIYNNLNICTTGSIIFPLGRIDVSLNYPGKEFYINAYGSDGTMTTDLTKDTPLKIILYKQDMYKSSNLLIHTKDEYSLNEKDNIKYSISYFKRLIGGITKSNIDIAIKVTEILEKYRNNRIYK